MTTMTWDEPTFGAGTRRFTPAPRAAAPSSPGDATSGGLRLTRRGRLVVTLASLAVAVGVGLSAQSATADGPGSALEVESYTVGAGETLWHIAGAVAAPGEDLRDAVAGLMDLNGLSDGGLQAGQQILVPVAGG
ncbi:MAG: Peptidoglycan-binding lysin domain protein [Actinotalea sp.]|nr:Peptidoglycan-binding lysin domain protein [Actinotalea sp.]